MIFERVISRMNTNLYTNSRILINEYLNVLFLVGKQTYTRIRAYLYTNIGDIMSVVGTPKSKRNKWKCDILFKKATRAMCV